jgi:hypothetical protein
MEPKRRQQILLGVLAVVLAGYAVTWLLPGGPAVPASGTSNVRARGGGAGPNAGITAPDVHLEALEAERPEPGKGGRNLFQFQAKAAPPSATPQRDPTETRTAVEPTPAATAPAPIPLKYLGVVESPGQSLKVASLTDGRGIYQGKEGDIIEGRYRIVRIGAESIEMTHLDGSGRQVIRQSGS